MLDLFTIFSKGGIVLWCFQSTSQIFTPSVNALIRSVILQERTGNNSYEHDALVLKYKLDNEFDLMFVVAYQKILQLSYVDKFLNDIHLEFRDKYKNDLQQGHYFQDFDFSDHFRNVLNTAEQWGKYQAKIPKKMRTFEDSVKSKKTVSSMIERKSDEKEPKKPVKPVEQQQIESNDLLDEEIIRQNRLRLAQKMAGGGNKNAKAKDKYIIGTMAGVIRDLEVESDSEEEFNEEEIAAMQNKNAASKTKSRGVFSMFRTAARPALDKLKDHLITKNVASDIAHKLCESVAAKLEGKVLGTFDSIASTVRVTLTEALVQILSPRRRVDILRDAMEAKRQGRPYVMSFCGVNGVGKSTNLAKICFWLIENNLRVLIAACDTFRAGAVEQLRTHTRHLNALHPSEKHGGQQMVQLYEKGYGKDAAGIAMEAINFARDSRIDVLIKVNQPDLVLFVGEALVGNEAVDQLVKFNQALADYSSSTTPHLIDGIVLTKFDTIDDKVGAAISMTYITGQPIVFVGTGQTYTDLKSLNAKAVVHALMK
ncbi:Signal recognition particle receptor subunit alpha [Blattella germanica]|nr:Signal recognition particle receptor subunit alpha [Blattella germanica]